MIFEPWSPVEIHGEVREKIKVYYKDELVTNVFLTQVKIRNSGNVPIKKEDVVEPVTLEFSEETNIVDWDVIDTAPKELKLDLQIGEKENQIQCNFGLLNEREEATLQIICFGKESQTPKVRARIAGAKIEFTSLESQSEIRWKARKGLAWMVFGSTMLIMALLLASGILTRSDSTVEPGSISNIVPTAIMCVFGLYFLAVGIYWRRYKRFIQ